MRVGSVRPAGRRGFFELSRAIVAAGAALAVAVALGAAAQAHAIEPRDGGDPSMRYGGRDASAVEVALIRRTEATDTARAAAANATADNRVSPSGVTLQNAAGILNNSNGYFFGADAIVNSSNKSYPSGQLGLELWATTGFPNGLDPVARIVLTGILLGDLPAGGQISFPFDAGTLQSPPTSSTYWISVGIYDFAAQGYLDVVTFRQERFPLQSRPCAKSDTNLCVNGTRFSLQGSWRDFSGLQQPLHVADPSTSDSGLFWFYGSNNWELLVKVLNACGPNGNNHYWVFGAAATTLEYYLTVKDLQADAEKIYFNPLGMPSASITDTLAFPTCP